VRPSLIADFVHHKSGTAPDGKVMSGEFYTLDYDFVMVPA
jgi:hydroxyquinol 1,2-dioxygenase